MCEVKKYFKNLFRLILKWVLYKKGGGEGQKSRF